jgi:hypothetical protein
MYNFIDNKSFLISLTIGLLITYLFIPTPKIIIRSPNLDNIDYITYKDDNDICYKYQKKTIPCTSINKIFNNNI